MKNIIKLLIIITSIFVLSSCSKKKKEEITSAEMAYTKAMEMLKKKNYNEAAEAFGKIDDEYPFSKWATKAQTMSVYAYYKEEEYAKLIGVVDDFVRLNPANENVPYMTYMKGLSFYNQIPQIDRAQDDTQQASYSFRELIARFPQTQYAEDAQNKLKFIDEHLAGAKMSIGRYQMNNKNFVGAVENFTEVINRYRLSSQTPEAYFRLVEIYYKMGIKTESVKIFQQLKSIYPQNIWVEMANKIDPETFQ